MDGLFPFLRRYCSSEQLIKDFHTLMERMDIIESLDNHILGAIQEDAEIENEVLASGE